VSDELDMQEVNDLGRIVKQETIDGKHWVGVVSELNGNWLASTQQVRVDGQMIGDVHHVCDSEEEAIKHIEDEWKQKFNK